MTKTVQPIYCLLISICDLNLASKAQIRAQCGPWKKIVACPCVKRKKVGLQLNVRCNQGIAQSDFFWIVNPIQILCKFMIANANPNQLYVIGLAITIQSNKKDCNLEWSIQQTNPGIPWM